MITRTFSHNSRACFGFIKCQHISHIHMQNNFRYKLLAILLSLHTISTIKARQPITSKGGYDIDGEQLFICRSHKYGQVIPGKYSNALRKCSVTYNRSEAQFSRYELLVESADTRYEWVTLKKPVTSLPENVLYGGNQIEKHSVRQLGVGGVPVVITDAKGELKSQSLDLILSSDQKWGSRKRRVRRSIEEHSHHWMWSRNWRGQIHNGVDRIERFHRKRPNMIIANGQNMTQGQVDKVFHRECAEPRHANTLNNQVDGCARSPQKHNFYISKCALRKGNVTSEQIGKIRWKETIQEWIASFGFEGHEIYCLDYSVLTLKV